MILRNFGPHESYDVNTDAAIIGLGGKNGAGKSNFLSAVEFGLRGKAGDADETLSSFIRWGAKKASVTLHFRKDGNEGIIERVISPTSSTRKLTWMGKTLTKDAEVRSTLNDILGVDEYVLQNAVFIPQGQLDKLLFGTPTEREEMFIKMMLLGYMSKISDVADQKAQMLARTVQDVSVLKDELLRQQAEAEKQLASVESAASRCPDMSAAIKQWNTICTLSTEINLHIAEAANAEDAAAVAANSVRTVLSDYSTRHSIYKVYSPEELATLLATQSASVASHRASITSVSRGIELRRMLHSYSSDLESCKTALAAAESEFAAAKCGATEDDLKAAKHRLQVIERVNACYKLLREADASVASHKEEIANRNSKLVEATAAKAELASQLSKVESEGRDLQVKLDTLKAVVSSTQKSMSHCPLCEQEFTKSAAELSAMFEETKTLHEVKKTQWTAVKTRLNEVESAVTAHEAFISSCNAKLEMATAAAHSNRMEIAGMSEVDEVELNARHIAIADMETSLRNQQAVQAKLEAAQRALFSAQSKLDSINEADKAQARISTEEVLETLVSELKSAEALLADTESCYKAAGAAESTKAEALAARDRHKSKEAEIRSKLAEERILPVTQNIIVSITAENPDCEHDKAKLRALVSNELTSRQSEHEQTKGLLAAAKGHANEAVGRLRELEKTEEINAETVKVIEELRRVKDAFSRKGIPRSYIAYYYDKLLLAAQSTLEAMEANFSIQPHPTKPVTLQFKRDNQLDDAVFEQNKLSGGQRVRVTMSFLLAVQKLLVPELGFLCLDEPSMHIDPEGQEAMRDMLTALGMQLAGGESQIWVSDHSDILATAYDKIIKLE